MALTRVGKGALGKGAIKDQTNLGAEAADTDEYLLYDASADALKAIQSQNVVGAGLITGKTELSAAASGDQILIYDISAGALKKVTQTNFLNFPTISSVSPTNPYFEDSVKISEPKHPDIKNEQKTTQIKRCIIIKSSMPI